MKTSKGKIKFFQYRCRYFQMVLGNYNKLFRYKNCRYRKLSLSIILRIFLCSKIRKSSKKVESSMAFSEFFMATHLFLFIHNILYAHIHKKNVRCFTKTYVASSKQYISHRSYVATKIMWVTKKYVVAK